MSSVCNTVATADEAPAAYLKLFLAGYLLYPWRRQTTFRGIPRILFCWLYLSIYSFLQHLQIQELSKLKNAHHY